VVQGLEPKADAPDARGRTRDLLRQPRIRLGALVAMAVAVVFIAWAVIGSGSSSNQPSSTPVAKPVGPVGLSMDGLQTLATAVGQPIYWAGPKAGYLYELTRNGAGNVYIRYLPPGAKVGTKSGNFLTIVTYPFGDAFQALKNVAHGKEIAIPGGGIALVNEKYPQSIHLAYPGSEYQIEVYDPSPARSLEVARSGAVRPVH
jgi:hypothetical protein